MLVCGGVLALLFPVTSDPWGVLCCACWPCRPGAGFRLWGCGGSLSSVPRRGGVPVGVCVAFGVSSGVCALRVLARACRVWLVVLRGTGGSGLPRLGLRVVLRCTLDLRWVPPGCGGLPGLVWWWWGLSGDGAVGDADGEGVGGDAPGNGAAGDGDGECRCWFVVSLVVPVVTALPVMYGLMVMSLFLETAVGISTYEDCSLDCWKTAVTGTASRVVVVIARVLWVLYWVMVRFMMPLVRVL